jgi:hypothetical protein
VLVNVFALFDHAVIIQQLGEDVIGSCIDVFSLIRFHGFAVFRLAHGPAHEGSVVLVDRLEDLFGTVLRNERLFADGDEIPEGVELVGPDIGVGLSGLRIRTGDVVLKFLALFVFAVPP